ncbi:hypothetical protein [Streptomyces spirodelae]|uniref:ATP-grasp domain-containing protein n=1 Tax=Streptomyces spirodelae TaxID=2812904 RepID=A0ABS3WYB3_9ACTN|nr:hypothetical protein [Streptomyces spirodelae]MBO8188125.1 hypothetical protein [Streptomyces spirodelae]
MTAAQERPGERPPPARPHVLPHGRYDELFETTAALLALVRRAVLALGPTWPERLVALGADPADHPPYSGLESTETDCCTMLASGEFVVGETGPRLVALGAGASLDSAEDVTALSSASQGQAGGTLFAHDPRAARAAALADLCAHRGLPRSVALVGPGFAPDDAHDLRQRGFTTALLGPDRLPGALGRPGRPRYALGLLSGARPAADQDRARLRDAQRAGLLLLPPLSSTLLADRRALALVSEGLPWMTHGERSLVERRLPWTRLALAGRTWWHGTEQELPELLLAQRERFVVKHAVAGAGPLVAGHETDERTWTAAVRRAFRNADSVVQEYVRPAPAPLTLSARLFADRPGGCRVRYPLAGVSRRAAPSAAPRCR